MSAIEQVRMPPEYFAKAKKEYTDWPFAWMREASQNSLDAGATKIQVSVVQHEDHVCATFEDDGCGMTETILRDAFLTMGGSHKNKGDVGGFGYAKTILLFSHRDWEIYTNDLHVTGIGGEFRIKPSHPIKGTKIIARMENKAHLMYFLISAMKKFYRNCDTDVEFLLNGEAIAWELWEYDWGIPTELGSLFFKESTESESQLWVRVNGIPMFLHRSYQDEVNFFGYLELKGSTLDLLTSNRDGLTAQASDQLQDVLRNLTVERNKIKELQTVSLTFNQKSSGLNSIVRTVSPEVVEMESRLARKVESDTETNVYEDMQEKALTQKQKAEERFYGVCDSQFPRDFELNVADVSKTTPIPVTKIIAHLKTEKAKKLAHVWDVVVRTILEAPLFSDHHYDSTTKTWLHRNFTTGFLYDNDVAALRIAESTKYQVLVNPLSLPKDMLLEDLMDEAFHELTHMIAAFHNQEFIQTEIKVRRSFRRYSSLTQLKATIRDHFKLNGLGNYNGK